MFDYDATFQRNIGMISGEEREILRKTKIAILGVGGVGGRFVESLVRLGCEDLLITDNAFFDPPDLNRQFSSSSNCLEQSKVECVAKAMKDINPEINLTTIAGGVTHENYKSIIDRSELILDAIDVNSGMIKQKVNRYAYESNKPVITTLLVGHGAICLAFDKRHGVSLDEYLGLEENDNQETFFNKLVKGVYPNVTSDSCYNEALEKLLEGEGHIPSSTANSYIAGALGTMAVRGALFNRPSIPYAPNYQQVDLFDMKYYVGQYNYKSE